MTNNQDGLTPADPRARTRPTKLAVVRNAEGRVLLASPTFEPDEEAYLDSLRDWLVEERRHPSFRENNTSMGPFDRLDGTLGPVRVALRDSAPLEVELIDHLGWGPAAEAARAIPNAAAVWTTRTGWDDPTKKKRSRAKKAKDGAAAKRGGLVQDVVPARHTTCPECGAAPSRIALRERICDACGADLPRPSR